MSNASRAIFAAAVLAVGSLAARAQTPPEKVVDQAVAAAGDIPAQAEALVRLAWPGPAGDRAVAAVARQRAIDYGAHAIPAMRAAVPRVTEAERADLVLALVAAKENASSTGTPDYFPALDDVLWSPGREARLRAMEVLARRSFNPSTITIIDVALEDKELLAPAVRALGAMRDPRARFFLERVLNEEHAAGLRESAAVSLAQIGDIAKSVLRKAMRSDDRSLRLVAVRALLPVADGDDLTALHEYVASHPDDDPDTAKAVSTAALMLERAIEAQQARDSASPLPE